MGAKVCGRGEQRLGLLKRPAQVRVPPHHPARTLWVARELRCAVRLGVEQRLAGGGVTGRYLRHALRRRQLLAVAPPPLQQPARSAGRHTPA